MMTKKEKLETLMLLSALESFCLSRTESARFPDYLIDQISNCVDKLGEDILEGEE
jgi:hypothetical protein